MPCVWRVETSDGERGLYQNRDWNRKPGEETLWDTEDIQKDTERHPSPNEDFFYYGGWYDYKKPWKKLRFGFANYGQYRRWLYDDVRVRLHKTSPLKLVLYYVKKEEWVVSTDKQCVFDKGRSIKMEEFPLIDVMDFPQFSAKMAA